MEVGPDQDIGLNPGRGGIHPRAFEDADAEPRERTVVHHEGFEYGVCHGARNPIPAPQRDFCHGPAMPFGVGKA